MAIQLGLCRTLVVNPEDKFFMTGLILFQLMENGQIGRTGQNVLRLVTTPQWVIVYVGQGHVIIQSHIMEDSLVSGPV